MQIRWNFLRRNFIFRVEIILRVESGWNPGGISGEKCKLRGIYWLVEIILQMEICKLGGKTELCPQETNTPPPVALKVSKLPVVDRHSHLFVYAPPK